MMKRMLDITRDESTKRLTVSINSSSLDVIQSCPRKAEYMFNYDLRRKGDGESGATLFGTGIHKALEHWYLCSPEIRNDQTLDNAIALFKETVGESIPLLASGVDPYGKRITNKRSVEVAEMILRAYVTTYPKDQYSVATDTQGPIVEREFDLPLFEMEKLEIRVHGRIDCAWRDGSQKLWVVDNKTTSSLTQEFIHKVKPNHQFTTYLWAAQQLGWQPAGLIMNGIQVAKTKQEFLRVQTTRTDKEIAEWRFTVIKLVQEFLANSEQGFFPQNTGSCYKFHSPCQYRMICEGSPETRDGLAKAYMSLELGEPEYEAE